MGSPL